MTLVAQVAWLALPVVLAGVIHITVIRGNALARLAALPLDGGLILRGRRLLGDHKTVRGVVVMVGATTAFTLAEALLARHWAWARAASLVDWRQVSPLGWGALLGAGYLLGELPNSFAKRRLGVAPGERPAGALAAVFAFADQVDSLLGVLACMCLLWVPPPAVAGLLAALTLTVHPALGLVMMQLGLKQRLG